MEYSDIFLETLFNDLCKGYGVKETYILDDESGQMKVSVLNIENQPTQIELSLTLHTDNTKLALYERKPEKGSIQSHKIQSIWYDESSGDYICTEFSESCFLSMGISLNVRLMANKLHG